MFLPEPKSYCNISTIIHTTLLDGHVCMHVQLQVKANPRRQSSRLLWSRCRKMRRLQIQQGRSGSWWSCSVRARQSSSTKVRLWTRHHWKYWKVNEMYNSTVYYSGTVRLHISEDNHSANTFTVKYLKVKPDRLQHTTNKEIYIFRNWREKLEKCRFINV